MWMRDKDGVDDIVAVAVILTWDFLVVSWAGCDRVESFVLRWFVAMRTSTTRSPHKNMYSTVSVSSVWATNGSMSRLSRTPIRTALEHHADGLDHATACKCFSGVVVISGRLIASPRPHSEGSERTMSSGMYHWIKIKKWTKWFLQWHLFPWPWHATCAIHCVVIARLRQFCLLLQLLHIFLLRNSNSKSAELYRDFLLTVMMLIYEIKTHVDGKRTYPELDFL